MSMISILSRSPFDRFTLASVSLDRYKSNRTSFADVWELISICIEKRKAGGFCSLVLSTGSGFASCSVPSHQWRASEMDIVI